MITDLGSEITKYPLQITADLTGIGWAAVFIGLGVGFGVGLGVAHYLGRKGTAKKLEQFAKIAECRHKTLESLKDKISDPNDLVGLVNKMHPYGIDLPDEQ